MRASLLASPPGRAASPDAQALERALCTDVRGEVRFDEGSRALYATDASNYRQVPIGVVIPRNEADVLATVQACQWHHAPLLARGSGTSLCGQCCNVAVVMAVHNVIELEVLTAEGLRMTVGATDEAAFQRMQRALPHPGASP